MFSLVAGHFSHNCRSSGISRHQPKGADGPLGVEGETSGSHLALSGSLLDLLVCCANA